MRWNQFGTPASILPADGTLAKATSADPVVAARAWLSQNAAVFGLTTDDVDGLELVNDQQLAQSDAHAVLFRQTFGDLTPALDSMVTVGVADGEIAYASSSITPRSAERRAPRRPRPSPPSTPGPRRRRTSAAGSPPVSSPT